MNKKTAPKTRQGDVIDHIDPRNSDLICGLDVRINKIILDSTTNNRKSNRFVPYMVDPDMAVHQEFGDWAIFLIQDKWCWCEFGGAEWWAESKRLGFSAVKAGEKTAELVTGIFAPGRQSAGGKKSAAIHQANGTGIFAPGRQSAGGKIGGKIGGPKAFDLRVGVHGRSAAQMTADGKIGGKIGGKITSDQQWQCLVTEYVSTPCGLSHWQKKRGIDTSLRVRRLDLEGKN